MSLSTWAPRYAARNQRRLGRRKAIVVESRCEIHPSDRDLEELMSVVDWDYDNWLAYLDAHYAKLAAEDD